MSAAGKHTPGPWRVGRKGCVVADTPIPEMVGSDDVDYYGGHMVAESVVERNAPLLAAAPELLVCAYDFREVLSELGLVCECGDADCRTTRLRAAILKATGSAA